MSEWKVLIAEDDVEVAHLHHRMVELHRGFTAVGIAESGEEVLHSIVQLRPDLVLLDLELRGMHGMQVLGRLRRVEHPAEVIAVTAAHDPDTVRNAVHLGVVDYLVKPFTPERLRAALIRFTQRMASFGNPMLVQEQVDVAVGALEPRRLLPRGLQPATLDRVRRELQLADGWLSAAEIADRARLGEVTARRYLEYLVVNDEIAMQLDGYGSPGRPRKLYRL